MKLPIKASAPKHSKLLPQLEVGYTGPRTGITLVQKWRLAETFSQLIAAHGIKRFHHGDCVGGDEHAHMIARYYGISVVIHPPLQTTYQAFCGVGKHGLANFDVEVLPPKGYFARDAEMVTAVDLLIGTPKTVKQQPKGSGTWWTIRHAMDRGDRNIIVIYPNGQIAIDAKEIQEFSW